MGQVIEGQFDQFRPVSFSLTADKIRSVRADYALANTLLIWSQTMRQIALRGEMEAPQRLKLLEAVSAIMDQPRLT